MDECCLEDGRGCFEGRRDEDCDFVGDEDCYVVGDGDGTLWDTRGECYGWDGQIYHD